MTVDIWLDIMCPFCYIGKRKLETALAQFPHKDDINIVWHSFQLDPTITTQPGTDIYTYLAERKGQTRDWAVKVHAQMVETAKQDGLTYNFDKAVIANSFNAHRLIQMAKTEGLGDVAEERIFKAYFTEGKNVDDTATLALLGSEIGLQETAVTDMLAGGQYAAEVNEDIAKAQAYGISGVPFFVLNNKYGISGAQPAEVFLSGLTQAWDEYAKDKPAIINIAEGSTCTPGDECN